MWILPSSIYSAFVRARECLTKGFAWPSKPLESGAVLWVTVRGIAEARPCSWRGWKNRPWSLHLFGHGIWKTSEAKAFEAWWTESLAGSRANLSALRESEKDWPTKDGFGMPSGSSPKTAERDFSRLKM
jgi:hypothetical protein